MNIRRRVLYTAAPLLALGVLAASTGCGDKKASGDSTAEERQSFRADASKMPPEARARMAAAQQAGAAAAAKGQATAGK